MTDWLGIVKHLLPNSRAWRLTVDKRLRQFFEGLAAGTAADARRFVDGVYGDLRPETTRSLDAWFEQFGLRQPPGLSEQQLRDRLGAAWSATGGQSPRYIQDTLQAAGFDVYVHEWWFPIDLGAVDYCGDPGAECGDPDVECARVDLVARNPFDYLDDGSSTPWSMTEGAAGAQDGDADSQDGGTDVAIGYPLVNKITTAQTSSIGDGAADMQDGDGEAQDGGIGVSYPLKQYQIPADPDLYPYFLYIGGETFPDAASVPASRRAEFEEFCLKICPTEQWLGIIVEYS